MDGDSIDVDEPASLFTPPKRRSSSERDGTPELENTSGRDDGQMAESLDLDLDATRKRVFREVFSHISPPPLSPKSRAKYKRLPAIAQPENEEADIIEIVGEYTTGSTRYLYARYDDTIIRRKEDWKLKQSHYNLYEQYKLLKSRGKLAKFDLSSTDIDPKDRVYYRKAVEKDQRKARGSSTPSDKYLTTEPEESSDNDGDDNGDDDDYNGRNMRSSKFRAAKNSKKLRQTQLPFSPRKTRLGRRQQRSTSLTEQSGSESDNVTRRRSNRSKPGQGRVRYDADYGEDELDEDVIYTRTVKKKARGRLSKRGPKPAYGIIRDVEDLDESDDELAPLRAHRNFCEKCKDPPAHILSAQLKRKRKNGKKRARKDDDDDEESEGERASSLGGWVRCLKCCVAAHWRCLARTQQDEILKAARAKDLEIDDEARPKRVSLETDESTEFVCGSCSKGGSCLGCAAVVLEPEVKKAVEQLESTAPVESHDDGQSVDNMDVDNHDTGSSRELLFRCIKCKRVAHYQHLVSENEDMSLPEIASHFQTETDWQCGDCASFSFHVEKILAWRPYPANAANTHDSAAAPYYKDALPREYLVKWDGRSYRRVQWVPHMWLSSTAPAMLKNFLATGPKVELLAEPYKGDAPGVELEERPSVEAELPVFASKEDSRENSTAPAVQKSSGQPLALADAENHISPSWKTVDRVLDVRIWSPLKKWKQKKQKKGKRTSRNSVDEEDVVPSDAEDVLRRAFANGNEPNADYIETVEEYEDRTDQKLTEEDIGRVVWAFIKWDDLAYDESTWDSPPEPGSFGYAAFVDAFARFLSSRSVTVPKLSRADEHRRESRDGSKRWTSDELGVPADGTYDIQQNKNFKLKDFQVNGVNWLCRNWYMKQQCILADEMGLGKTVQIVTFLGLLHARMGIFPSLVVVPNSTITNWVREFARWAPQLRVVPYYGENNSREIIKKYELFHDHIAHGTTGAKFHVLITTYDTASTLKDVTAVFKRVSRWEVLVVDEGQRLKSDSSQLFKRLTDLNSRHRVLMTGTPLNNNIRELFNLMNFLDPDEWNDLDGLTKRFEELDDERVKDLHEMLRPYFLRRVKADVLQLPPKNEVIVPVSMAPLQKEVYKSLLSKNVAVLTSLASSNSSRLTNNVVKRSNINNLLMQLRKCLQHPYIMSTEIEPKGLSVTETHTKLIDACGKLRLLKILLPRLKARGHRVLLFSQFKLALDIIEDFLTGEGYKFLRLDGDVKQQQRQKDMDEFNRENSDIFIYILSTRAGGVGINLWSADTVIIYDPDFNPHQDLQAIARAHRFGQTKTCLVFKLMTKGSCEEKIFQAGKKKLVLDHVIVQKMDTDEDASDIQSMLTFGASELFNENPNDESKNITYTEQDIENLIEKTEKEGDNVAEESSNNALAFAHVWSRHKEDVVELEDDDGRQDDAWTQTLAKMVDDQKNAQKEEKTGRGARRKAALAKSNYFEDVDGSPEKKSRFENKRRSTVDSEDEYRDDAMKNVESDAESATTGETGGFQADVNTLLVEEPNEAPGNMPAKKKRKRDHTFRERSLSPIHNAEPRECGLCNTIHGAGGCMMTHTSQNLVEYRKILISHAEDEPWNVRVAAVAAIDKVLYNRNELHLIDGQPSKPIRKQGEPLLKISHYKPKPSPNHKTSLHTQGSSSKALNGQYAQLAAMPVPSPPVTTPLIPRRSLKLSPCPLCALDHKGRLEECVFVREGSRSITIAITTLLNKDGDYSDIILALRRIQKKMRPTESSQPMTSRFAHHYPSTSSVNPP